LVRGKQQNNLVRYLISSLHNRSDFSNNCDLNTLSENNSLSAVVGILMSVAKEHESQETLSHTFSDIASSGRRDRDT
jgi:fluoride ion exporter CrcB/FEX